MKQFHIEVPVNPDGMIELFYKPDLTCYDANDFKIVYFTTEENELLQNFMKKVEMQIPVLSLSNYEDSRFIHAEDVKDALKISDEILTSCAEPEASAVRKMRDILIVAAKDFKPVHFFPDKKC